MLRALLIALALANLGFYAWSRGWLDGVVGVRARGDREPERLARQVRPEVVRILPPAVAGSAASAAEAAASAASAPTVLSCLEAGPFAPAQAASAEAAVQAAVPRGGWRSVAVDTPGIWLVYMGKYASRDLLTKKEDELKRRKVEYEEMTAPAELAPGLSLGRFDARAAADAALVKLNQQSIHTARVVELEPAATAKLFRVDQADAALASRLGALKGDALGAGFVACTVAR